MTERYPVVVYDILAPEEIEALWRDGELEALARAIAKSIRTGIGKGDWIVRDGKVVPSHTLQFHGQYGKIIMSLTVTKEAS